MDSKTVGDTNRCLRMIVNLFTNVYHSDQFRNYGGTKVSDDFNKTIQMNKSSKFYSMMTVQRFEQQTDEIIVIASFTRSSSFGIRMVLFFIFFKKLFQQFPVLFLLCIGFTVINPSIIMDPPLLSLSVEHLR